jgi:hypothetical protein
MLETYPAGESYVLLGQRCKGVTNGFLTGAIEEARLYDRPLSADEVAASYRGGVVHFAPGQRVGSVPATAPAPEEKRRLKLPEEVAAAGSPEQKIAARGLALAGSYVVVASEAEALDRHQKIRALIDQMEQTRATYEQAAHNEMLLAEAEQYRLMMIAQVVEANGNLSRMPNGPRANNVQNQGFQMAQVIRDGYVQERDTATAWVEILRRQQLSPERKEELTKDFEAKRAELIKAVPEVKKLVEKAREEYIKLQGDKEVGELLIAIRRSTEKEAKLGPSAELGTLMETIQKFERMYPSNRRR